MGHKHSSAINHSPFKIISSKNDATILVLGPRGSGKSQLLRNSKIGDITTVVPFEGFSCEKAEARRVSVVAWDCDDGIRPTWINRRKQKIGLVFVCNANKYSDLKRAKHMLSDFLDASCCSDDMPLLVVVNNKCGHDMSLDEVSSFLNLNQQKRACNCIWAEDCEGEQFVSGLHWVLRKLALDPFKSLGTASSRVAHKDISNNTICQVKSSSSFVYPCFPRPQQ
eukprot:CAMPEP_0167792458 /NCGR_PEP_ID=MMETSP0111_2-20121227/12573_1 /TAXON_ID=91324 /ORGANISM="Lotharella globosa, Strain CCCM811" /LENGTH=223 /DNA_ID=CAMNT_0007685381 /DNA_START=23 /DNA_END=694 /DNA_ORIENTATION=+